MQAGQRFPPVLPSCPHPLPPIDFPLTSSPRPLSRRVASARHWRHKAMGTVMRAKLQQRAPDA